MGNYGGQGVGEGQEISGQLAGAGASMLFVEAGLFGISVWVLK